MNKNVYMAIIVGSFVATLQAEESLIKANSVTLFAYPKQLIQTTLAPNDTALVQNMAREVADVDVIVVNTEGKEVVWDTIELEPNDKIHVSLKSLLPELDSNDVSEVHINVSVRPSQYRQAILKSLSLPVTFFSQTNPSWRYNKLGTCNLTIGSSGCAITSISMVANKYKSSVTPSSMNSYLTSNNGYANGCDVYWYKAANVDGPAGFTYVNSSKVQSATNLKSLIDSRKYAVARSARISTSSHYVLIFGYINNGTSLNNFYYFDPADSKAILRYVGDGWVSANSAIQIYK